MPLLGAHMSIEGGLPMAFERITLVKGQALQIFSKNQRQWRAPELTHAEIEDFNQKWEEWGRGPVAVHDSYLINLANPDEKKANMAVAAFAEEIRRADQLSVPFLIMHPGSHVGSGIEQGLTQLTAYLDRAFAMADEARSVTVLLETTAGQGTGLGASFEELAYVLDNSASSHRLAVCFDTCHAFAAGYDIRKAAEYEKTFAAFDRIIGLDRLKFFHLNDSKKGLGSRVDRHEHIGRGEIGLEGFRLLMNDPRFADHPMVLETPKEKDLKADIENLKLLRSLIQEAKKKTHKI
ncbi:MAG: deoxyribonuclease IV [Deltaproteobacteria bacterium]|jgi:deoxyribonuclease-4|nr:deoxyribonuclease IV [Deltaproteobacteria bacterium]